MTDKEFDSLLKDALIAEDIPKALNASLFEKAKKKSSFKLIKFAKAASAVAAVFICAVAVYNTDIVKNPETVAENKPKSVTVEKKMVPPTEEQANKNFDEKKADAPIVEKSVASKKAPAEKKSSDLEQAVYDSAEELLPAAESGIIEQAVSGGGSSAVNTENTESIPEIVSDTAAPQSDTVEFSQRSVMMRKAAPSSLSGLFNEGYDYKSVIDGKISAQISALPNSGEFTFSGISGNEEFALSNENLLTITFTAGEILPVEHGEQFFTVGTVINGALE